jgi:ABC-type transport system substrate-binding protein
MNTEKRKQLYSQLLRLIRDDAPYIFGYQQMDIYGVNSRPGRRRGATSRYG